MFNKKEQEGRTETIIGPSVKVKGDFHGEGNVVVEGVVEGSLKTNKTLTVGNNAKITANIEAEEAYIGGEVNGNIKVKGYLEISSSAKIFGDIECSLLSINKGAFLNGKCSMSLKNDSL